VGNRARRFVDATAASSLPDNSPDVQNYDAPRPYKLGRVGVRHVKKLVKVHRPGQDAHDVTAVFDLFVDLPATQKGTHMSRNLEALADILDGEIVDREARSLENLCARLVEQLLEKHDYAETAQVIARGDFFLTRQNPGGKDTQEAYGIRASAEATRGQPVSRRLGVEVVGATACPCAMETARAKFAEKGITIPEEVPFITHNQRNIVILDLELPEGSDVDAKELVDLCEASLSAPTHGLLKRGDEGDLVIQSHHNPKFVEDVVREVLHKVTALGFPAQHTVFCSSEAEESIHKHNAFAERTTTFGEIES
jgi:GTP cyclohydrolase-4